MSTPDIIFGTALLGMTFNEYESVDDVLQVLKESNIMRLDTAARYPPTKQGESERLLGSNEAVARGFAIDSKVFTGFTDGSGELTEVAISDSIEHTLQRLGTGKLKTLYCHRFDPATPLEETALAFDRQYKRGKFERWGVCRFPPAKLEQLLRVCEEHGYVKPSAYQGEYNIMTRGAETTILPILRAHGMHYNAHRPFATGFLTGNFTNGSVEGTRFADDFPLHHVFRKEYDDEALHAAIKKLSAVLDPLGLSVHEASLRWMMYHSSLGEGDGIIFGSSKLDQIRNNAAGIAKGPLPSEVAKAMGDIWDDVSSSREAII